MNWEDATSWSRHDNAEARKTPRTWQAQAGVFRLIVTRHIDLPSDCWRLRCDGVCQIDTAPGVSATHAKLLLVEAVRKALGRALDVLRVAP